MFDPVSIGLSEERPRERLLSRGASALSLPELLALVIGTGTRARSSLDLAHALLEEAGDARALSTLDVSRLARQHGLGSAKAARIVAALELGRRVASADRGGRAKVTLEEAARLVGPDLAAATEERLVMLLLDRRDRLMRTRTIYQGTVDGLIIKASDVLRPAIEARATAIILAHNHPSGDPTPSAADVSTTRQLVRAGVIVGVDVREHLVIGGTRWSAIVSRVSGEWG